MEFLHFHSFTAWNSGCFHCQKQLLKQGVSWLKTSRTFYSMTHVIIHLLTGSKIMWFLVKLNFKCVRVPKAMFGSICHTFMKKIFNNSRHYIKYSLYLKKKLFSLDFHKPPNDSVCKEVLDTRIRCCIILSMFIPSQTAELSSYIFITPFFPGLFFNFFREPKPYKT